MKIIIGIAHPKQVHFWKNIINLLVKNNHIVKIVAWDKDITLHLLDAYGFKYELIGVNYKTLIKKAYGLIKSDIKLLKLVSEFNPDILLGGSPYLAQVSKVIRKPHIGFTDTENAKLAHFLFFPFCERICTPSCYKGKIDPKKHIIYNGYEELAYLHPNYFSPNPSVLDELEFEKYERYIILRFVSWGASHDGGHTGISLEMKLRFVKELQKYGHIFITSEKSLPGELEKYRIKVLPEKMHDLLSYASLLIGESATMASECAVLGIPAIFIDYAGRGYTDEQEKKYGLVYNFKDDAISHENALRKAIELLENEHLDEECENNRRKLLNDKIDVTEFITSLIERYI